MGGKHGTLDERVDRHTRQTEAGCVEWTGPLGADGWARIGVGRKGTVLVHRYLWERENGLTGGRRLERNCPNPRCVRHFTLSAKLAPNAKGSADHFAAFDDLARTSAIARFMSFVDKNSPRGCWLWIAGMTSADGYGRFYLLGRTMVAHRASYILHKGAITDPMLHVMHACDDRRCVNPDHLSLGTHGDNMLDKKLKGRAARGTRNAQAAITEQEVVALRGEYVEGRYGEVARLADKYRISITHVTRILAGEAWAHLAATAPLGASPTADEARPRVAGGRHPNAKVKDSDVAEMRKQHAAGIPAAEIAARYGLSYRTAWGIVTGRAWKHLP